MYEYLSKEVGSCIPTAGGTWRNSLSPQCGELSLVEGYWEREREEMLGMSSISWGLAVSSNVHSRGDRSLWCPPHTLTPCNQGFCRELEEVWNSCPHQCGFSKLEAESEFISLALPRYRSWRPGKLIQVGGRS